MKEWIYGRNAVYECLTANRRAPFRLWLAQGSQEKGRVSEILRLCSVRKVPVERLPRQRLDALAENHQGVALEAGGFIYSEVQDILNYAQERGESPWILLLDTLQDPQNLGSLLRTAEIVGVHGVILPLRHSVTITPAVVNASSGASEHLLVAQANLAQAIATLKKGGIWVVGLDGGPEALPLEEVQLSGPLAFVIGNEGEGMRSLVRDSCDFLLRLPMKGKIESLNAAVAGSVALYLAWQARGFS